MKKYVSTTLVLVGLMLLVSSVIPKSSNTNTPVESVVPVTTSSPTPIVSLVTVPSLQKKVRTLNLTDQNVVELEGEVNEGSLYVASQITTLGNTGKPIYLLINSPGGSVLNGAMIISAMEASKVPVYTVCKQLCASMAAIIHQYGTERYMIDRSTLMFHDASAGLQGSVPQMISRLNWINSFTTKMDAYIAKRNHQTTSEFVAKLSNELWLDSEDSLSQGYADSLVIIDRKTLPVLSIFTSRTKLVLPFVLDWK